MGIHERSGDIGHFFSFFFTAASAPDCTAGVYGVSPDMQDQSTRGSVDSRIPSLPSSSQVDTSGWSMKEESWE